MTDSFEISSATGVDLQLNIAGPGARSYAFVIDWHIRFLLALAWFIAMNFVIAGSTQLLDSEAPNYPEYVLLVLLPPPAIYFLYHPVLEIAMRGRTPGKRIAGIRIVTENAQTPGVLAHLIRNILRILDSLPFAYVVGLIATTFTEKSVRIGDIAAGTVLIYESDARGKKDLKPDIDHALITRYGLARAELAQELVDRWGSLDKHRRKGLAEKLLPQLNPGIELAATEDDLHRQLTEIIDSAKRESG